MMLTVKEAAERIAVSDSRIRQLIGQGKLSAVKQNGAWLVPDYAIDDYAAMAKVGRPSKRAAESRGNEPELYTLMSGNHEIALVTFSPQDVRFTRMEVLDELRLPMALNSYRAQGNRVLELNQWWGHRAIPRERPDLEFRFLELGVFDTFSIPFANYGLSMSDQYWLRPAGSKLQWEALNYYRNHYDLGDIDSKDSMSEWMTAVGLNSPDNTTDGMLSKRWIIDEGERKVLIKGSSPGGREAINEYIATRLYRRLLGNAEYVDYRLGRWHGKTVSVCESFLREDEEFIPAWYVFNLRKKPNNWSEYRLYTELCWDLHVRDAVGYLDRMLVCDSILANTDRHWRNFGIIRNIDNLKLRPAPIFDSGSCLWNDKAGRDFSFGSYAFTSKPFYKDPQRQLDLVCDGRWYHPEALEGFVDEVRGIMEREGIDEETTAGVCRGLEQRIDAVNAWWRATPTHGLTGEWAEPVEMVEWIWW